MVQRVFKAVGGKYLQKNGLNMKTPNFMFGILLGHFRCHLVCQILYYLINHGHNACLTILFWLYIKFAVLF